MGAPPPIAIQCECGDERTVDYGGSWTCERCGRRWDTRQIPETEYLARLRRMRWFRLELVAVLVLAVAVFVPLIVFVDPSYLFLALIASGGLVFLYMPFWRRRVRRAVADAPTWDLRPE
jgi:hypothetical protein